MVSLQADSALAALLLIVGRSVRERVRPVAGNEALTASRYCAPVLTGTELVEPNIRSPASPSPGTM
jgi:hypothetical protein